MKNCIQYYKTIAGIFLSLCCIFSEAGAQQSPVIGEKLEQAKAFIQKGNDSAALQNYRQVLSEASDQKEALSYTSILLSRKGERQEQKKDANEFYQQAQENALKALQSDPNYTPAPYAYALSLYHLSLHRGMKEKFKGLKEVKDYLDRTIMLDSSFAKARYLMGRWNMAFNKLNVFSKTAVKLFFGGLPDANAKEAISCYEKCRELSPSFIQNYYYLAQALHADGKDLKAISTLKEAISLRPILQDDRHIQQKCREMIKSLQ